ncbi:hypothetical protein HYPSUDRAFT_854683 [Hypholoma sublateritium FD-334 SS-4]|uniref:Uncharacterized protein n=1 Tax=Hypholoma sublateritium (strain FD-334 SS-4) TaxID=945553 RepID=A0A0D2M8V5_HYPSF|nr:hypothetical protein HYPSUDRAFT_854683 [Hypholoma sublateritium FD-334 SS-4]
MASRFRIAEDYLNQDEGLMKVLMRLCWDNNIIAHIFVIFVWIYISSAHFTASLPTLSLLLCCRTMFFTPGSFRDILSLDLKVALITRRLPCTRYALRERSAKIILRNTDTVRLWDLFLRYKEERSPQAPRRSSLPARLVYARVCAFSRRRRCRVVRHGRLVPEQLPQTRKGRRWKRAGWKCDPEPGCAWLRRFHGCRTAPPRQITVGESSSTSLIGN